MNKKNFFRPTYKFVRVLLEIAYDKLIKYNINSCVDM